MDKKVIVLSVAFFFSVVLNVLLITKPKEQIENAVSVERHTDIQITERKDTAPHAVREIHLPPVKASLSKDSDSEDSECRQDMTLLQKGDTVIIPVTQKVYEDSSYTAYVSGYMANLDSIRVRERIVTDYVRERITTTKTKMYGFGVVGGVGYGMINRNVDIYIGIGGYINLWKN